MNLTILPNQQLSSCGDGRADRARAKWAEKWGAAVPLSVGKLGPHLTQCRLGWGLPPYQVDPDLSSCLATIDMDRKVRVLLCPFWGELGRHLTNVAWAEAYLCTNWQLDPCSRLATDMGRRLGG